jgi:sugar lactone lactonase YvrE
VDRYDTNTNFPEELAISGRYAWIIASSRSHPVQFDLRTKTARQGPELGRGATAIVADRGTVWIAYRPQNRVVQIDARTGLQIFEITTPIDPTAVAVGSTGLWIATQERRDDPAYLHHFTRDGTVPLYGTPLPIANGVADLVHGAGAMWMAIEDTSTIRRYDADGSGRVWNTLLRRGTDLAYGAGSVWALSEADSLVRIDPETSGKRKSVTLPGTPQEVGISGRLAIVTMPDANRLHVVDRKTLREKRGPAIDVRGLPFGIATRGRHVYVTAASAQALVELKQ